MTKAFSIKLIATAAVINPIILVKILNPLFPRTLEINLLPNNARKDTINIMNKEAKTTGRPDCCVKYMEVVIAPGPANSGVPIGTIASEIFVDMRLDLGNSPCRKSNDKIKRRIPPAIINAGIETPKRLRSGRPPKEKIKRSTNAAMLISNAALICLFLLVFPNRIRNIGIAANGSTIAKRATVVLIISTTILFLVFSQIYIKIGISQMRN